MAAAGYGWHVEYSVQWTSLRCRNWTDFSAQEINQSINQSVNHESILDMPHLNLSEEEGLFTR